MAATLDILLISPGNRSQVYQNLGDTLCAIEPPVWAGLMATYVRTKGLSVAVIDGNAEGLGPRDIASRVRDLNPVLTVIVVYGQQPSASTQNMPAAGAVATAIRDNQPERHVLMVGGHVAALPEQTLREEDVNYVSGGEGLLTMVELSQALRGANPNLTAVHDLWYWDNDTVRHNAPAPLVREIEGEMHGMAWDLLPMERYRAHNWHCFETLDRAPYASMYTSLGCPYKCSFCCIQAPFKSGEAAAGLSSKVSSYRMWSPEAIGKELETLVETYGVRNIKFADELFVLNRRHVNGICDIIIDRGYDLNIWAYARVDSVKDDDLETLRRAGVTWLALGIEAGSDRVRDDVDKGYDPTLVYSVCEKIRAAGIHIIGNYIFGLPEDDLNTMQETLDLAIDLNCEFANFYSAMAYPGSTLYSRAIADGIELPPSWSGYSQHAYDTQPLPTHHLSPAEVLAFRDQAFTTYFQSSRYLDMVEQKFGTDTRQHVTEMTSKSLKRQLLGD